MNIHTIVVGDFQVNCFLLEHAPGKALVVDPGDSAAEIASLLEEKKLVPEAYLLTHGHVDHIAALCELNNMMPAPIALHADDAEWAFTEKSKIMPFIEIPRDPGEIAIDLKTCATIPDISVDCKVIQTPGHTPGSVCLHFPKSGVLISGDTLFAGSVGRTDLPGGSSKQLAESLEKLKELPDDTQVLPGHGPSSTIGHEKRINYFMQTK